MCSVVVAGWLFLIAPVMAIAESHDPWQAGQLAFEREDFAAALAEFETAAADGVDGPAVHYNIAVCQYKLERYEESARTFRLIADRYPRMRGLAEYNLGLTAHRLGDTEAARAHFLRAYEESGDNETLRILSSRMLGRLPEAATADDRLSGAFGLRSGHDDNVVLLDALGIPAGQSASSPMLDVFGLVRGPVANSESFNFELNGYAVAYADADDFDQLDFRGSIFYQRRAAAWQTELGAGAGIGTFGGDLFDRRISAEIRASRDVGDRQALSLRYAFDRISDANEIYSGIDGTRQQVDVRYRYRNRPHYVSVLLRLEDNDRDDPGVSPRRYRVGIGYRYWSGGRWSYEAGASYRNSRFSGLANSRNEDLRSVHAGLAYEIDANWQATGEIRYAENDSSDAAYAYDRTQVTVGIVRGF